jgi:hypothetical protein
VEATFTWQPPSRPARPSAPPLFPRFPAMNLGYLSHSYSNELGWWGLEVLTWQSPMPRRRPCRPASARTKPLKMAREICWGLTTGYVAVNSEVWMILVVKIIQTHITPWGRTPFFCNHGLVQGHYSRIYISCSVLYPVQQQTCKATKSPRSIQARF